MLAEQDAQELERLSQESRKQRRCRKRRSFLLAPCHSTHFLPQFSQCLACHCRHPHPRTSCPRNPIDRACNSAVRPDGRELGPAPNDAPPRRVSSKGGG